MENRKTIPSRRSFLQKAGAGTVLVTMGGLVAHRDSSAAEHLPKLDPGDPTAKALEYTHDSPKSDQFCNNCNFWQGGDKDWGGCAIFPGKEVSAKGWCKSWIKQSG